jgi:hypothetical protein
MQLRKAKFKRPTPEPRPCDGGCGVMIPNGSRCVRCRVRKCRGTDVEGRACTVPSCGITFSRVLRLVAFGTPPELVPLCANHAALAGRRGLTLEAFLAEAAEREAELTPIPASVRKAG